MSYRTFKHLLGETSLERKCRFIFGGGIFILVAISFTWYGLKAEQLVLGQQVKEARARVDQVVQNLHISRELGQGLSSWVREMSGDAAPRVANPSFESHLLYPRKPNDGETGPRDAFERNALASFLNAAQASRPQNTGPNVRLGVFPDGTPTENSRIAPGRNDYQYIRAVLFQRGCLNAGCHDQLRQDARGKWRIPEPGEFAMAMVINLPMADTNRELHFNRTILISTALVTAVLAMLASWVIVRYIVVKPVKHLRDVSDAIATGKLNIRSQIQTGDEFEELSHAFNRMLHNLVAMQQELRDVNADLDKKVDELAQANMALFEMNRLKSDFLATMSHELRTPLNSIIGFSEVLAGNESLNDRQRRYASNIQTSGKMLLGMINDILDLAKIESGKMEVRVEDFSIRDVCEGLVNLMRPIADRKNLELVTKLDEAIPLLRQDPGKIRQIIYNLLSNALKFTPEGGRVQVEAHVEGRHVVLAVTDTGIGIAEEDRERIFEKFRQVQTPTAGNESSVLTREHQGTGLGLSIVRELARLLGGDIQLESQPGQGSTFTVKLPLQLTTNRHFEVAVADERVDLSKARRVESRNTPGPHAPVPATADGGAAKHAADPASPAAEPRAS